MNTQQNIIEIVKYNERITKFNLHLRPSYTDGKSHSKV